MRQSDNNSFELQQYHIFNDNTKINVIVSLSNMFCNMFFLKKEALSLDTRMDNS